MNATTFSGADALLLADAAMRVAILERTGAENDRRAGAHRTADARLRQAARLRRLATQLREEYGR